MSEQKNWENRWDNGPDYQKLMNRDKQHERSGPGDKRIVMPEDDRFMKGFVQVVIVIGFVLVAWVAFPSSEEPFATASAASPAPPPVTKRNEPEADENVTVAEFQWQKGWASVMTADVLIANGNNTGRSDIGLKCTTYGPSGTKIDTKTITAYVNVPAGGKKWVRDLNLGFIDQQASNASCTVTSAKY